jgi:hypothetical protein
MSVYVDDMEAPFKAGSRTFIMCHMLADTDEELHEMASAIGISRAHWQRPPKTSHYDIAKSKRVLAVKLGAVEVTMQQMAAMVARRRFTGSMGDPKTALSWYFARNNPEAIINGSCSQDNLPASTEAITERDSLQGQLSMNF